MRFTRDRRSLVCFGASVAIALEIVSLVVSWRIAFPAVSEWFNDIGASLPPLSVFFMKFHVAPIAVLGLIAGSLLGYVVPLRFRTWVLVVIAVAGGMVVNAAVVALFPLLWGIANAQGWAG